VITPVVQAFTEGDPEAAWTATYQLVKAYQELEVENAKMRFLLNFGTSACDHCEGLQAGPEVVATCFQVHQCRYTNIKEGDGTTQSHLVEALGKIT
jgi:hypothetical protein